MSLRGINKNRRNYTVAISHFKVELMDKTFSFKTASEIETFLPFKGREFFIISCILQVVIKGENKEAMKLYMEWLRQQNPNLWDFKTYLDRQERERQLMDEDLCLPPSQPEKPGELNKKEHPLYIEGYLEGLKDATDDCKNNSSVFPRSLRFE